MAIFFLFWEMAQVDMKTFGHSLLEICQQTRGLLMQEPRLLKLNAPTYILGKEIWFLFFFFSYIQHNLHDA